MVSNKDYYEIIGLTEEDKNLPFDDFLKVLKKKYRKACLIYHPDKLNGKSDEEKMEAEEKFKEISEAYSVLSDEDKKRQYDNFGTVGQDQFGSMDEMMEHFMRMNGFTENPFRRSRNMNQQQVKKGSNIQLNVKLTVKELYEGGRKTVKYHRYKECTHCHGTGSEDNTGVEKCPHCNGMGRVVNTQYNGYGYTQVITTCPYCQGLGEIIKNPCQKCHSSGLERMEEIYTFDIPSSIQSGQYLVVNGMGNGSTRNEGINGDLYLMFTVVGCDDFIYSDDTPYDVYVEKFIPILDCITGCDCIVSGIDGKSYSFKIKAGTENESVLKLQHKGLPKGNGSYGDLRVVVRHKFPKELSKEETKLLEKLKNCKNFKE